VAPAAQVAHVPRWLPGHGVRCIRRGPSPPGQVAQAVPEVQADVPASQAVQASDLVRAAPEGALIKASVAFCLPQRRLRLRAVQHAAAHSVDVADLATKRTRKLPSRVIRRALARP